MFSYYGGKATIAHLYPEPKHDLIIEPFAGAARYALRYWQHPVLLIEKYEPVYRLWKWLIEEATLTDIEGLPELTKGLDLRDLELTSGVRLLLSFCVNHGVASPHNVTTYFASAGKNWASKKATLLRSLPRVKHWKIIHGDYSLAPDVPATWFIDPPYDNAAGALSRA